MLVLTLAVSAALWYAITHIRIRPCNLNSRSPDGMVIVHCLPFKGVKPHPLDGCVRVYIYSQSPSFAGDLLQTTVHCDGDIRLVWHNDAERSFSVFKGEDQMMTWRTSGADPTCTLGGNLITYDPHELWSRLADPSQNQNNRDSDYYRVQYPTKDEQNGCRQRLEGYLSCQPRPPLAVA